MPEPVIYSKSPITEAIIDIRIEPSDNFDINELISGFSNLKNSYSYSGKKFERNFKFNLSDEDSNENPEVFQTHVGYRFRSNDQKQVLEVTGQSLSLSRLSPYTGWEEFKNQAQHFWSIYQNLMQPISITRVGVRYINQLDLPKPFVGLQEYLTTFPQVATAYSKNDFKSFFMHVQIPQEDINATLIVNQAMLPQALENQKQISIVFDIELFMEKEPPLNSEEIWKKLSILRERKNLIFNSSITDKMKELIK